MLLEDWRFLRPYCPETMGPRSEGITGQDGEDGGRAGARGQLGQTEERQ